MSDNTIVHPACQRHRNLVDHFLFQGRPINNDPERQAIVLVNQGYVVGFCPRRLQCVWAGYRVAGSNRGTHIERSHQYYDDIRLHPKYRIGPETFGVHDGLEYRIGQIVPDDIINRQFGMRAQLETFLMSNTTPQRDSFKFGMWRHLENKIRVIDDSPDKDHVWVITGPVFGDEPDVIQRPNGTLVPIPYAYYYIIVDPFRWPWNQPGAVDIAYFVLPQDADRSTPLNELLVTREQIEAATNLTFFPNWESDQTETALSVGPGAPESRHRLLCQLS